MPDNEYKSLSQSSQESKKDDSIAVLESRLSKEKDGRREDRFYFGVICLILIDVFTFQNMQTWSAPIIIVLLEMCILIPIARKCGVEAVVEPTEKILNALCSYFQKKP